MEAQFQAWSRGHQVSEQALAARSLLGAGSAECKKEAATPITQQVAAAAARVQRAPAAFVNLGAQQVKTALGLESVRQKLQEAAFMLATAEKERAQVLKAGIPASAST
ncbi:unnamed protein product, partial [Prorocentrum cordatum]